MMLLHVIVMTSTGPNPIFSPLPPNSRFAFATMITSDDATGGLVYLDQMILMICALKKEGYPIVVMVTEFVTNTTREKLTSTGAIIHDVGIIPHPRGVRIMQHYSRAL